MKRQAKPSTAAKVTSNWCRYCHGANGCHLLGCVVVGSSNAVTDIALLWIRERAAKQHANYRPLDLTLREAINAFLVMDSSTPWQQSLRARINALLG